MGHSSKSILQKTSDLRDIVRRDCTRPAGLGFRFTDISFCLWEVTYCSTFRQNGNTENTYFPTAKLQVHLHRQLLCRTTWLSTALSLCVLLGVPEKCKHCLKADNFVANKDLKKLRVFTKAQENINFPNYERQELRHALVWVLGFFTSSAVFLLNTCHNFLTLLNTCHNFSIKFSIVLCPF